VGLTHEVLDQPPLLVDYDRTGAHPAVFDAVAAIRLSGDGGGVCGTLPRGPDLASIFEPAIPSMLG